MRLFLIYFLCLQTYFVLSAPIKEDISPADNIPEVQSHPECKETGDTRSDGHNLVAMQQNKKNPIIPKTKLGVKGSKPGTAWMKAGTTHVVMQQNKKNTKIPKTKPGVKGSKPGTAGMTKGPTHVTDEKPATTNPEPPEPENNHIGSEPAVAYSDLGSIFAILPSD